MSGSDWAQYQTDWGNYDEDMCDNNDNYPKECQINKLGEYELIKILSYLTIAKRMCYTKVCAKWQTIIEKSLKSEHMINHSTVLGSDHREMSEPELCDIIKKCPNVKHIVLRDMGLRVEDREHSSDQQMTESLIITIANYCHYLQTIDFSNCFFDPKIWDNELIPFASFYSQLKKFVSEYITEKAINSIIDSQSIEMIDISRNIEVKKVDLNLLGPNIRQVYLIESEVTDEDVISGLCEGNGRNLTHLSIDIKHKQCLTNICNSMKQLRSVEIDLYNANCDFTQFSKLSSLNTILINCEDESKLETHEFVDLVKALKNCNISEFEIHLSPINNIAVDDNTLPELALNLKKLEKLSITKASSLTCHGMYTISQMESLKRIDFISCTNIGDGIDVVITSCPNLRVLNLHNCSRITIATVDAFVAKALLAPNESFTLDVVDTMVGQDMDRDIPPNLTVLFRFDDCVYRDCNHGWGDEWGYNSEPDDFFNGQIDDFYDVDADDSDYDYFDEYEDEDDYDLINVIT